LKSPKRNNSAAAVRGRQWLKSSTSAGFQGDTSQMNVPAIKKFCASLPHATGDIKWGVDQVYSIGGRMFCVAFVDTAKRSTVSFKVDDDLFLQYTDRAGFIPAPYMARAKWVQVIDLKMVSDAELKALIDSQADMVILDSPTHCFPPRRRPGAKRRIRRACSAPAERQATALAWPKSCAYGNSD
jgi:predicted DNA-binding protein (MmcQ/YjbR family)